MLRARILIRRPMPPLPTSLRIRRGLQSQSNDKEPPSLPPSQDGNYSSMFIQDQLSRSAEFAFDFFKRFAKLSLLGIFAVSVTGLTAFEGAHFWVENVGLLPDMDPETSRWEWNRDVDKWSGGDEGGTDPALGFKGRHMVRAAWMVENWTSDLQTGVVRSTTPTSHGRQGSGGLNIVDARLSSAEEFLSLALEAAEDVMPSGKLHPQTFIELVTRRATVLEHMATRDALFDARSDYEHVWFGLSSKGPEACRTALKLGDLNFRLGDYGDAIKWWARTISMAQGSQQSEGSAPPAISPTIPSSPFAQRTLASALVSLSAYYSTSHRLKEAQELQHAALSLLRSIPAPTNITASPPHLLHVLYMLHRSSLISIHLAEVLYATRSPHESSLNHLCKAAESAEQIALSLSGRTLRSTGQGAQIPPAGTSLMQAFTKSNTMRKPAKALLRDARRTAAEAWKLMGILSERDSMPKALDCYERALAWAGVPVDGPEGSHRPGEGIPEGEWKVLWSNYVRAREEVRSQGSAIPS
ncbi:hypothetical protein V8B97DRAFT_1949822 [Scleroderma yunnanense]